MRSALFLSLLLSGVVCAQTVPTPAITGALNFRDLGGIRTSDGHVVRSGMIFRSGELSHLTASDFDALAPLHIHYIFDLRTEAERATAPTHWIATQPGDPPTLIPLSVGFPATEAPSSSMKRIFANGTAPGQVKDGMKAITVQIALDGAPEIGTILRDLAHGDEAAIIHCTAGKDRTGVVIAVLLRVLGVPMPAIEANYLRSNDAVPAQLARLHAVAASTSTAATSPLASLPPDSVKVLMGVDPSYLAAAFAAIDSRYGSFDKYVAQALKLTPDDIQSLRGHLLESAHGPQ